jgi:hypothetical protein
MRLHECKLIKYDPVINYHLIIGDWVRVGARDISPLHSSQIGSGFNPEIKRPRLEAHLHPVPRLGIYGDIFSFSYPSPCWGA